MRIDLNNINFEAIQLMRTFSQEGEELRIAGGAPRDIILGQKPKDWDFATPATPARVMEICEKHGIHTIPTGLQHGTVTAMMAEPFEITTLRADVATDGRHADVEFITDWRADAERRDFTMNAMYIDENGELFDPFGGIEDIEKRRLNFVGDPEQRIKEDYLRILRYFRFATRMNEVTKQAEWSWDNEQKVPLYFRRHAEMLNTISGERIWTEMKKIIAFPNTSHATIKAMADCDVLRHCGLEGMIHRWYNLKPERRYSTDPSVLIASCYDEDDWPELHRVMEERLKTSRDEREVVRFAIAHQNINRDKKTVRRLLAKHPQQLVIDFLIAGHNATEGTARPWAPLIPDGNTGQYVTLIEYARKIVVPEFPISGADLIADGMEPGPKMGKVMKFMRDVWADKRFMYSKENLLKAYHDKPVAFWSQKD